MPSARRGRPRRPASRRISTGSTTPNGSAGSPRTRCSPPRSAIPLQRPLARSVAGRPGAHRRDGRGGARRGSPPWMLPGWPRRTGMNYEIVRLEFDGARRARPSSPICTTSIIRAAFRPRTRRPKSRRSAPSGTTRIGSRASLLRPLCRPEHRAAGGGHPRKAHPAARDHGAHHAADRGAAGRRSRGQPVLQTLHADAGLDLRRRPRAARRRRGARRSPPRCCRRSRASTGSSPAISARLPHAASASSTPRTAAAFYRERIAYHTTTHSQRR